MCDTKGLAVSTEWAVATPQRRCCHGICRGVRTSQVGINSWGVKPAVSLSSLNLKVLIS